MYESKLENILSWMIANIYIINGMLKSCLEGGL